MSFFLVNFQECFSSHSAVLKRRRWNQMMMWDCLPKQLKIKLVYTEKPSADVFWLITIPNTVDLQVSDILMLLTQITTRLADLLNFRGEGGGITAKKLLRKHAHWHLSFLRLVSHMWNSCNQGNQWWFGRLMNWWFIVKIEGYGICTLKDVTDPGWICRTTDSVDPSGKCWDRCIRGSIFWFIDPPIHWCTDLLI